MTKDQFTAMAAALVRHILTLASGALVTHGVITSNYGDLIAAASVFIATVAWSFVQKHKLLAALCNALPPTALEQILDQAKALKAQGADPLVIAHMAGTAAAIAQGELAAVRPDLVIPNPAPGSPPGAGSPALGAEASSGVSPSVAPAPVFGEPDALPVTEEGTSL